MDEALNLSGERFQNNATSVSGFTGFVWTEGRTCKKICGFKNIPIRADVALMKVARSARSYRAPGERVCRAHRFTLTHSQEKMLLLHFFAGKYIFVLRATKHSISHKMFEFWVLEFSCV